VESGRLVRRGEEIDDPPSPLSASSYVETSSFAKAMADKMADMMAGQVLDFRFFDF